MLYFYQTHGFDKFGRYFKSNPELKWVQVSISPNMDTQYGISILPTWISCLHTICFTYFFQTVAQLCSLRSTKCNHFLTDYTWYWLNQYFWGLNLIRQQYFSKRISCQLKSVVLQNWNLYPSLVKTLPYMFLTIIFFICPLLSTILQL